MVKVRGGQSIFDITTQQFGQIDNVVQVSSDNDVSISGVLETNQELIIDPSGKGNNDIKKEIIEKGLSFSNDVVKGAGNFSKWFLPSKDEIKEVHDEIHAFGLGGFGTNTYWSSSEQNPTSAWYHNFGSDSVSAQLKTYALFHTRAVRSFTAPEGAYSLRETGPSGGLIFYVLGTTYMEVSLVDQSATQRWSNVALVIGTTGTAIGTGLANSNAIVDQPGHTDSAAKLCLDYES